MPDNANQQTFVVHKSDPVPPFVQLNLNTWMEVHRELKTGAAFSLWMWYASNADGYSDDIYSSTIIDDLNLSKQSYYNARDKLCAYGYLIPNRYKMYEYHYYNESPVRMEWRRKVKSDPKKEKELQALFKDLINKKIPIEDLTLEEWWLYNRGKKYHWEEVWDF